MSRFLSSPRVRLTRDRSRLCSPVFLIFLHFSDGLQSRRLLSLSYSPHSYVGRIYFLKIVRFGLIFNHKFPFLFFFYLSFSRTRDQVGSKLLPSACPWHCYSSMISSCDRLDKGASSSSKYTSIFNDMLTGELILALSCIPVFD